MEYLPGKRLDDLQWLDSNGISRDEVSAALARIFNEMVFGKNAPLHCDPHGGNIAIRLAGPSKRKRRKGDFEIILYDHGLYRDIPTHLRRSYAKLWLAVIDGNESKMRRYAGEVAGVTDEQFPLFASAITGRDFIALQKGVSVPRGEEEKRHITQGSSSPQKPTGKEILKHCSNDGRSPSSTYPTTRQRTLSHPPDSQNQRFNSLSRREPPNWTRSRKDLSDPREILF